MEQVTRLLFDYGIGFVIVGLFIYDWITNKKDIKHTLTQNEKALEEIANSTKNTAKSLELLQQSMNEQKDSLAIHDKRCEKTQFLVEKIEEVIEKLRREKNEK